MPLDAIDGVTEEEIILTDEKLSNAKMQAVETHLTLMNRDLQRLLQRFEFLHHYRQLPPPPLPTTHPPFNQILITLSLPTSRAPTWNSTFSVFRFPYYHVIVSIVNMSW